MANDSFYGEYAKFIHGSEAVENRYRPRLVEVAKKIVNFETKVVSEKMANIGTGWQFEQWLSFFYEGNFLEKTKEWMGPVVKEVMTATQIPALEALGEKFEAGMDLGTGMFASMYTHDYALRHGSSSRRQILAVIRNTEEEEPEEIEERARTKTPEELAVQHRFDEWLYEEKRARAIAMDEKIREVAAASHHIWKRSGVKKLMWKANHDACPLCKKMDGRTVNINEPFLGDGEVLLGEFEKKPKGK